MSNKAKPIFWLIFIVYTIILIKVIFFNMPLDGIKESIMSASMNRILANLEKANFIPFQTIKACTGMYFVPGIKHIGLPILWFIPLGYFIPALSKRKWFKHTLIVGMCTIISFEVLQIILSLGRFDVDDIILNGLGITIGYMFYKAFR